MIEPIVEDSSRPVGELIEDFDVIADQLIPYSQLPPRLAAYSEVYRYWRDIGAHSSKSLTAQPGIGLSALAAITDTARRAIRSTTASHPDTAVGAAAKLIDQLDTETRIILTTRVFPLDPTPTAQVAAILGCAKASVSRGARRAARLAGTRQSPAADDPELDEWAHRGRDASAEERADDEIRATAATVTTGTDEDDDWTADDGEPTRVRGTGEPLGVLPARGRTVEGPVGTEHESSLPRLAAAPPPPVPAGTSLVDVDAEEEPDEFDTGTPHRRAVGE